jgi:hypothetical protein
MGVDSLHPEYQKYRSIWERNRSCYDGEEAIKAGGVKYLPMLGYHKTEATSTSQSAAYETYKQGAVWFDGTYRTVTTMSGLVFRKHPFVLGEEAEKYRDDFSSDNRSLANVAKTLIQETTLQGRVGLLVSYPDINTKDLTKAEVTEQNIHAYTSTYKTEDIINWRVEKRNGRLEATMVVLKEYIDNPDSSDMFYTEKQEQYRVLYIDSNDGTYHQALYRSRAVEVNQYTGAPVSLAAPMSDIQPQMDGKPMTFIPFFPIAPSGITWELERAPMNGICALNIGHYINSAAYESGLSLTASPTLVLKGYQTDGNDTGIVLGGNSAISLSENGDAVFLEYKGQGMDGIADAMKEKKEGMAVLGVKILTTETPSNTSAEAIGLEQTGEQAVLAAIANTVGDALSQALKLMVKWDNPNADTDKIKVQLNTDFTPNSLTANQLNAITVLHSKLGLSDEELFELLKRGEILSAEMSFEEHQAQLEASRLYELMGTGGAEDPLKHLTVNANRLIKPENPNDPNAKSITKGAPTSSGGNSRKQ